MIDLETEIKSLEKEYKETKEKAQEENDCKVFVLSKKYLDYDELLEDNDKDIYFDKNVELANKFLLRGLPTTVFINKKGEEFARIIGFVNFDDKKIIKWLQKYD